MRKTVQISLESALSQRDYNRGVCVCVCVCVCIGVGVCGVREESVSVGEGAEAILSTLRIRIEVLEYSSLEHIN